MDRIVVDFQPFALNQTVVVWANEEQKELVTVPYEKVADTVTAFRATYGINDIVLFGNKDYLTQFRDRIGGAEYAMGTLNIEIMER